ncbi:hypothetical protein BU17DRAFT_71909 [Hysterangium stoloniferum]|nr:hypothetical protein BU17DRAFT_71909 [Hysterangium stoloniferum]
MGKSSEFLIKAIEQAFSVGTDQKLKWLCNLYNFELNCLQQLSSGCPGWDWDIDKLEHYCRSLSGYASPLKTAKTQLEAFKDIVRVVICHPSLRRVFYRDSSIMGIEPEVLWKRLDEECMDDEYKFFRQLAVSCIAEKGLEVTVIVEKVWCRHSIVNTRDIPRIIAIRCFGGILQLAPFWVEERNKLTPTEKLLASTVDLVKNLGLDLSEPCTRRKIPCQDTEGIDFLVAAVLKGMDG